MLKLIKNFIIYSIVMFTVSGCFTPETLVSLKHKILGNESDENPTSSQSSFILTSLFDGFCATNSEDKEFCWGKKSTDEAGVPYAQDVSTPQAAVAYLKGKSVTDFKMQGQKTCAITSEKRLYCWGDNDAGVLGIGSDVATKEIPFPVDTSGVLSGKDIIDVEMGDTNICAIDSNHILYCWGLNNHGQLGSGSVAAFSNTPVVVQAGVLTVQSVSIGDAHICAIASDNNVYCWGKNDKGQLGNGSLVDSSVPVLTDTSGLGGAHALSISLTTEKSCMIASDNKLYCWGEGFFIGLANDAIDYPIPTAIPVGANLSIRSLSQMAQVACAITTLDVGYCWGAGTSGQNGDGQPGNGSKTPVAIVATGSLSAGVKSIAVSIFRVCAVSLAGEAYCWGGEGNGDGDAPVAGNYASARSPVAVSTAGVLNGVTISDVDIQQYFNCLRDSTGEVYCWSGYFSAGDGIGAPTNIPVSVSKTGSLIGKSFQKIRSNTSNTCGLASDNQLYCWGLGGNSQGSGTPFNQNLPLPVYNHTISNIALTDIVFKHSDNKGQFCVQKSNGDFYCKNLEGNYVYNFSFGSIRIKKLFYSDYLWAFCALTTTDKVYCWGYAGDDYFVNTLSIGSSLPKEIDQSTLLAGKTIADLGIGESHACVLTNDKHVYCWGKNDEGELGNGLTASSGSPVALDPGSALGTQTIKKLYVNNNNTCVIANDDLPYCWGKGMDGLLGNGSVLNALSPVAVSLPIGVKAKEISMTVNNVCVISLTDELYCWGKGSVGVLGNGVSGDSNTPLAVVIPGALGIKKLSLSDEFACAIGSDDNAYCWGTGSSGEMGDAQFSAVSLPVAVDKSGVLANKTIKSISTTSHTACVVASDEKIYCWGAGLNGQLANNISADSNVPVEVLYTP